MQRKILVVQPEPPVGASLKQQGSYETVLKSAEALKSRLAAKGTTEVILKENEITAASLANVLGTEKIYIIGHGDGKLVGRKTPEQLAKLLITTGGLTQAKAITVLACLSYYTEQRTGSGDIVEDETYTKKLVLEIRKILGDDASALRGINVKGRTGFVHINEKLPSTRVRGTTPEQVKTILGNYSECGKEYNDLLEEYGQHTDPAQADEWAYSAYKACMAGKGKDKSIKVHDAKAPESFRRIAI